MRLVPHCLGACRRQQANASMILAPIKVSQQRLAAAMQLMEGAGSDAQAFTPVLQAVRESSLTCYAYETSPEDSLDTRASMATLQVGFMFPRNTQQVGGCHAVGPLSERLQYELSPGISYHSISCHQAVPSAYCSGPHRSPCWSGGPGGCGRETMLLALHTVQQDCGPMHAAPDCEECDSFVRCRCHGSVLWCRCRLS
jgi:hypothetical protein